MSYWLCRWVAVANGQALRLFGLAVLGVALLLVFATFVVKLSMTPFLSLHTVRVMLTRGKCRRPSLSLYFFFSVASPLLLPPPLLPPPAEPVILSVQKNNSCSRSRRETRSHARRSFFLTSPPFYVALLSRIASLAPPPHSALPFSCYYLVHCTPHHVMQRKPARAAAILEECLTKAPQSKELKLLKVDSLMGVGKHEEAYAMSSALIRNSQNNSKLLITRAQCLYLMGNLDSAVKHLQVLPSIWAEPLPGGKWGRALKGGEGGRGGTRGEWSVEKGWLAAAAPVGFFFCSNPDVVGR